MCPCYRGKSVTRALKQTFEGYTKKWMPDK